jgi:hypothetical protein
MINAISISEKKAKLEIALVNFESSINKGGKR